MNSASKIRISYLQRINSLGAQHRSNWNLTPGKGALELKKDSGSIQIVSSGIYLAGSENLCRHNEGNGSI
jgi:hypothetical protein